MHPGGTAAAAVGGSKLGGVPDLGPDTYWPQYDESLAFIAQISLHDCHVIWPENDLPRAGLLSFFYVADQSVWGFDPKDRGAWRVLYTSERESLRPFPIPVDVAEQGRFNEVALRPSLETTYAPWESSDIAPINLSRGELFVYADALAAHTDSRFARSTEQFGDDPKYDATTHRLLGHPDPIQGDRIQYTNG